MDTRLLFAAIDATGAGVAIVRDDGTVGSASPNFGELAGASAALEGAALSALLPDLPALESLGSKLGPDSPAFVHGGFGRVRRVLAAALMPYEDARCLLIADRESPSRARAELRTGPVEGIAPGESMGPRAAGIRPMTEMGERTAHALALARRYGHDVTVVRLEVSADIDSDLDGIVLGCVRGVDDVGRSRRGHYLLLLPDTDLAGARVVSQRIHRKLQGVGVPSLGLAQSSRDQDAANLLEQVEAACAQATRKGGGLHVASATKGSSPAS